MRKMIVWLLMLCLAISMAACRSGLSGTSGERDNDSEKQTEREDTGEKQTEQDSEKSTGGKKEPTLPDSGFFPWGKPDYPEDPFLWITPETTLDELLAVLGEPTEKSENDRYCDLEYEDYVLYDGIGKLWFRVRIETGLCIEAGFAYEYPGRASWSPQFSGDKYVPSETEVDNAESYVLFVKNTYMESIGDQILEINYGNGDYSWSWNLPNGVSSIEATAKISLIINQEFQASHPVEIYYTVRAE